MIKDNSKTRIKKSLLTLCFFLCITSVVGQDELDFEEDVIDNPPPSPIDKYEGVLMGVVLFYGFYKISEKMLTQKMHSIKKDE
jgi:hypothetical protein